MSVTHHDIYNTKKHERTAFVGWDVGLAVVGGGVGLAVVGGGVGEGATHV